MSIAARVLRNLRWLFKGGAETPPQPVPHDHARWLQRRIEARGVQYPLPAQPASFSVLTPIYDKTDAALLRQTAASLARQTLPYLEWVLVAQGPLSAAADGLLDELAADRRVRISRLPHNLGIVGGLRRCLEAASGDYVVPVDGDDLLTPDALQILASVIEEAHGPAFLYSDEDILRGAATLSPYWRPDWDPVLNLSSSYIWHLCAFRRELALSLGAFSDPGSDWCHDWDSVTRFARAGHAPVHVPEILYHWRHHELSSTNRARPHEGSMRSTRHVLERHIAQAARPELYAAEHFPLFRGVFEWHIGRRRRDAPATELMLFAATAERAVQALGALEGTLDFALHSVTVCLPPGKVAALPGVVEQFALALCGAGAARSQARRASSEDFAALATAARASGAPLVWLLDARVTLEDADGLWDAYKFIELQADVGAVSGRLVDDSQRVAAAPGVILPFGGIVRPGLGAPARDPGPYALALKPHTVAVPVAELMLAKRDFLVQALEAAPGWMRPGELDLWISGAALERGVRIAYTPLLQGRLVAPVPPSSPSERERDVLATRYGRLVARAKLSSSRFLPV